MKVFLAISLLAACALVCSCASEDDNTIQTERSKIESYLKGLGVEYVYDDGVFRYVANADRAGYDAAAEAHDGSSVDFFFDAYTFSNGPYGVYYSNKQWMIDSLGRLGQTTKYLNAGPQNTVVGSGALIKGLDYGLRSCRQGDSVLLFITSDLAYGDKKDVGTKTVNTPLVYSLIIDRVR